MNIQIDETIEALNDECIAPDTNNKTHKNPVNSKKEGNQNICFEERKKRLINDSFTRTSIVILIAVITVMVVATTSCYFYYKSLRSNNTTTDTTTQHIFSNDHGNIIIHQ